MPIRNRYTACQCEHEKAVLISCEAELLSQSNCNSFSWLVTAAVYEDTAIMEYMGDPQAQWLALYAAQ